MEDEHLRVLCMQWALATAERGELGGRILQRAEMYFEFLIGDTYPDDDGTPDQPQPPTIH